MKALIDTNILLDVLLGREPWAAESKAVWDASDAGRFDAYVSAISLPNIFYIGRKIVGLDKARAAMTVVLEAFEIIATDRAILEAAAALSGTDFEDNIQLASALASGIDVIVTRDSRIVDPRCQALKPGELSAKLRNP